MNYFDQYAYLVEKIKILEEEKANLVESILSDMTTRGVEKEEHSLGKFTISKLKTWTYSDSLIIAKDKLKAKEAKEQSTGVATYIEKESLRFTPIHL